MSDPKSRLKKQRDTASQASIHGLKPVTSESKSSPHSRTSQLNSHGAQLPKVSSLQVVDNFSPLEARVTLEKDFMDIKKPSDNEQLSTSSSDISSSSEDDDLKANLKTTKIYKIPRKSKMGPRKREIRQIFFDSDFRREDMTKQGPVEIDARVKWIIPSVTTMNNNSESECEFEIEEYIKDQARKKEMGLNVTGETFWYDPDRSLVRNLHTDSVSITSYEAEDKSIFGRADILHPTLTTVEKKMLGIQSQTSMSPTKKHSADSYSNTKIQISKYLPSRLLEKIAEAGDGA